MGSSNTIPNFRKPKDQEEGADISGGDGCSASSPSHPPSHTLPRQRASGDLFLDQDCHDPFGSDGWMDVFSSDYFLERNDNVETLEVKISDSSFAGVQPIATTTFTKHKLMRPCEAAANTNNNVVSHAPQQQSKLSGIPMKLFGTSLSLPSSTASVLYRQRTSPAEHSTNKKREYKKESDVKSKDETVAYQGTLASSTNVTESHQPNMCSRFFGESKSAPPPLIKNIKSLPLSSTSSSRIETVFEYNECNLLVRCPSHAITRRTSTSELSPIEPFFGEEWDEEDGPSIFFDDLEWKECARLLEGNMEESGTCGSPSTEILFGKEEWREADCLSFCFDHMESQASSSINFLGVGIIERTSAESRTGCSSSSPELLDHVCDQRQPDQDDTKEDTNLMLGVVTPEYPETNRLPASSTGTKKGDDRKCAFPLANKTRKTKENNGPVKTTEKLRLLSNTNKRKTIKITTDFADEQLRVPTAYCPLTSGDAEAKSNKTGTLPGTSSRPTLASERYQRSAGSPAAMTKTRNQLKNKPPQQDEKTVIYRSKKQKTTFLDAAVPDTQSPPGPSSRPKTNKNHGKATELDPNFSALLLNLYPSTSDHEYHEYDKTVGSLVMCPTEADVLCCRGGESNNWLGNKVYRCLVRSLRPKYQSPKSDRQAKRRISHALVNYMIKSKGARFLKKIDEKGRFYIMSTDAARKKAAQLLRERKKIKWF